MSVLVTKTSKMFKLSVANATTKNTDAMRRIEVGIIDQVISTELIEIILVFSKNVCLLICTFLMHSFFCLSQERHLRDRLGCSRMSIIPWRKVKCSCGQSFTACSNAA